VVQRGKSLRLKVDNYYSLGGTGAATYERTQADLPLILHGAPRSAFFLGLGTGITAGAAVGHPLDGVTVVELIREVVEASRLYFGEHTNGLFDDPRVRVIVEDGRNYLLATDERYDVIVGDLFIPWQSGAAGLYTLEHFAAVRARLHEGGLFAQWLPLYQLSRDEFMVIARTMTEVFPNVTLWRDDFLPERPIVALIGHANAQPLDVDALVEGFRRRKGDADMERGAIVATTAIFYAGNVSAYRDHLAHYHLNTDDWPVIEYSAPITQREARGKAAAWFVGAQLEKFYAELTDVTPPRRDPYLVNLTDEEVGFVEGGRHLFASKVYKHLGDEERAAEHQAAYTSRVPDPAANAARR
jgi:spermidine synthase